MNSVTMATNKCFRRNNPANKQHDGSNMSAGTTGNKYSALAGWSCSTVD